MIHRDRLLALGLAVAMFALGVLALFVPYWILGVGILALGAFELAVAHRADDWAVVDVGVGAWLCLLAGVTVVTPAWGIPLLFVTAGAHLVRAAGDLGMAVDLALLAALAYARETPTWAVATIAIVAVGKLLWFLREYYRYDSPLDVRTT